MTNLEAIAMFLRIEKTVSPTCTECAHCEQYIRRQPDSQLYDALCCAGCFTLNMAVNMVMNSPAMEQICNVAILMDLSIDPRHVMTVDKHAKLEEQQSNFKLDSLYNEAPDARPIIEDICNMLREAAKNWQHPLFVYTALIRTSVLIFAALHWAKGRSLPVVLNSRIQPN